MIIDSLTISQSNNSKAFNSFILIVCVEQKPSPVSRFLVDWRLWISDVKCRGRKITVSTKDSTTKIRITTLAECAKNCRGTSSLFTFGRHCSIHGCDCECEIDADSDGSCNLQGVSKDEGIELYKFDKGKYKSMMKNGSFQR